MIQGSNVHLVGALIGALALFTLALAVFLPYVGGQQGGSAPNPVESEWRIFSEIDSMVNFPAASRTAPGIVY